MQTYFHTRNGKIKSFCYLRENNKFLFSIQEKVRILEKNLLEKDIINERFSKQNNGLVFELEQANNSLQKFIKGSNQVNKILQNGKMVGDKKGFGYSSNTMTLTNKQFIKVTQEKKLIPNNISYFIPTCYHFGKKGHIQPNCGPSSPLMKTIQEMRKKVSILTYQVKKL